MCARPKKVNLEIKHWWQRGSTVTWIPMGSGKNRESGTSIKPVRVPRELAEKVYEQPQNKWHDSES